MIYIDGLEYAADNLQNSGNRISASKTVEFSSVLAAETANLNVSDKTCSLEDIFREASEKYNVSIDLLKAIGYNESRFQADATSSAGAMGIMQLMPSTAKALGVTDAYDPYQNIMGAAKLLSQLSDMYDGNQTLMIAAYNAGSGNVAKYGGIPPFKETQNYVAKVLSSMHSGVTISKDAVTVNTADTRNSASTGAGANTYNSMNTNASLYANPAEKNSAGFATDSFYTSSNLDNIFSYSDYELLMSYFEHMLEIISSIGDTGNDSDSNHSKNDSLQDLFRLGNSSFSYNRSNIDFISARP